MDFLDPKKQKAHGRRLAIGYALLGVALLLSTVILLYLARGYGIDRKGQVIQNGFVFVSSRPSGAKVYVNGREEAVTDTRLQLAGGAYTVQVRREGYRSWQRAITVEGGVVERFDYPLLIPAKLTTTTTKQYATTPSLFTQSPDRRWLIVQGLTQEQFDLYDLNDDKPVPQPLVVPSVALTPATLTTGWEAVEWAEDNQHVLLRRNYVKDGKPGSQYILFDREEPSTAQNLSLLLGFTPTTIALREQKFDQYYLYDQPNAQLLTATLKQPSPQPFLSNVLAFATRENRLLYVTNQNAPANKVLVQLRRDDKTYILRQLPAQTNYLLNLAAYNDKWFVAAGAQNEDKIYVYKNPESTLDDDAKAVLVPIYILKVGAPNYLAFSTNFRSIVAESADRFTVYDAETDKAYAYQIKTPLDTPQGHATWLDGYHLAVTSGSKVVIFDFDGANTQILVPTAPTALPVFDRGYQALYTLNAQNALTSTSLLVK